MADPDAYQPRRPPRRIPVWGFPDGYNPNAMGDPCELCRRADRWISRRIPGISGLAWICQCCSTGQEIPLD